MPKANGGYWEPKLARDVERDSANDAALEPAGGTVLRFIEHVDSGEAALVADAVVRASWPGDSPMI